MNSAAGAREGVGAAARVFGDRRVAAQGELGEGTESYVGAEGEVDARLEVEELEAREGLYEGLPPEGLGDVQPLVAHAQTDPGRHVVRRGEHVEQRLDPDAKLVGGVAFRAEGGPLPRVVVRGGRGRRGRLAFVATGLALHADARRAIGADPPVLVQAIADVHLRRD